MGAIGDEWDRSIHDLQCKKYKEDRKKVWETFKSIYKIRYGVEYPGFLNDR